MIDNSKMTVGRTIRKKFVITLLCGMLLFGTVLGVAGFTGTAFAVPLGGMGDFYVTFDKLEGEGFELKPQIGETGDADEAPLVRNTIDKATIENLHIYKDLKMPMGGWVRFNIKASEPTEISGLIQDARFIDANLKFDDMTIEQSNTSGMSEKDMFQKNWTHDASTVTITDAEIVTDYLFQNMVALNGAKISVESIDNPEHTDGVSDNKTSDQDKAAAGFDDNNGDDGGLLSKTASNILLPVLIGAGLVLAGGIILITRKVRNAKKQE